MRIQLSETIGYVNAQFVVPEGDESVLHKGGRVFTRALANTLLIPLGMIEMVAYGALAVLTKVLDCCERTRPIYQWIKSRAIDSANATRNAAASAIGFGEIESQEAKKEDPAANTQKLVHHLFGRKECTIISAIALAVIAGSFIVSREGLPICIEFDLVCPATNLTENGSHILKNLLYGPNGAINSNSILSTAENVVAGLSMPMLWPLYAVVNGGVYASRCLQSLEWVPLDQFLESNFWSLTRRTLLVSFGSQFVGMSVIAVAACVKLGPARLR